LVDLGQNFLSRGIGVACKVFGCDAEVKVEQYLAQVENDGF
jgi:hypothetical protein